MRAHLLAAAALAALLVVSPMALPNRGPAEPSDPEASPLVGAVLHSRWLDPASPLGHGDLLRLAQDTGVQVMPFGVPLRGAGRAEAARVTEEWLARTEAAGIRTLPTIHTLLLPRAEQTPDGIRALFAELAPAIGRHGNVVAVIGANEPLTKGKQWPSPADAEARVRLEYRLWHEVSDAPFCHKFTNPRIDTPGTDWAMLERLWAGAQDAICYDWYASNQDTLETLDRLRELGRRLGKPVHVAEAAVPGNDPARLRAMAERADTLSVYQLLGTPGGEDERHAAWLHTAGGFRPRAQAGMLQALLAPPAR